MTRTLGSVQVSILGVAILLSGCATNPVAPPVTVSTESIAGRETTPPVGVEANVEVGANMYSDAILISAANPTVTTLSEATGSVDGNTLKIPSGTTGPLSRTTANLNALCVARSADTVLSRADACLVDPDGSHVFMFADFKFYSKRFTLDKPVPYTLQSGATTRKRTPKFRTEVLYEGRTKDSIKISFREFSNDLARPAFNQEISYDFAPDGTAVIAFKGLRINVLKATSSTITYKVINPIDM